MPTRDFLIALLLMAADGCNAQTRGVVADIVTRVPLRDVRVISDANEVDSTNYRGEFALKKPFSNIRLGHKKYLSRMLDADELRGDTVYMIPLVSELSEVVVTGRAPRISKGFFSGMDEAVAAGAAMAPGGIKFDFFAPLARFDRSKRYVSKKKRKHQQEVLENY